MLNKWVEKETRSLENDLETLVEKIESIGGTQCCTERISIGGCSSRENNSLDFR
jgi:hypothetical protein